MTSEWGTPTGSKAVVLDGDEITVSSNKELVDSINELAVDKGLSKFKVYVNDAEITDPSDLDIGDMPDTACIKVTPYDKASDDEEAPKDEPEDKADESDDTDSEDTAE